MTRFNLAILVALAAAVAGLFFWVLQIREGYGGAAVPPGPGTGGTRGVGEATRIGELEQSVLELREMVRSAEISTNRLDQRVTGMEAADAERDRRISALARGEAVPEAALPPAETELRSAIEQVLDQREEEARLQRLDRTARGMARYLLADVSATDTQREEFVKVIVAYIEGRERVRRASEEVAGGAGGTETDLAALEAVRDEELRRIFGESDFAKIAERLDRGRRGAGGRGGVDRRPGGAPGDFGPGRTSPRPR
jgi:hypothetical protein